MNKKNKITKVLLIVLSLCIFFGILFSATPNKVNYQGVLKEKGQLITGIKKMKFSIYDSAVGGNLKWTSGVVDVEVKNGVFRYVLNLPSDFDWSKGTYYLEVEVEGQVLSPREEITSSIYAIHSKEAEIAKEAQSVDWSDIKNKPPEFSGGELSANSIGSYHIIDSTITDADISPQANISWSKISKSGSSLGDLGGILPADKLSGSYLNDVKVSSAIHAEVADSVVGSVSAEQDLDMKGHNILNLSTITAQSEGIYLASNVFVTQGNFGIGTTAPDRKLDVNGGAVVRSSMVVTGAGLSGTQPVFQVAGSTMVVQYNGNVGIGTTTPSQKLSVVGDIGLSGANRFIGTTDNYDLSLRTNNSNRVYITSTGNVGIGTTTPAQRLQVAAPPGAPATSGTTQNGILRIARNDNGVNVIDFGIIGTASPWPGWIQVANKDNLSISYPLAIQPVGGNVGIGTTEPGQKLEVAGNVLLKNSGLVSTVINSLTSGDALIYLQLDSVDKGILYYSRSNSALHLWESGADRLVIKNGNVGIGTAGPAQKLHVEGNTYISGNVGIGTTNPGYTLHVNGSFAANSKNFEINHPTKPGKKLVHACIEGPEVAVYYRGEGKLIGGSAIIELPDYFEALTRKEGRTVQLTAKGTKPYLLSASEVKDGKFMVYGTEPDGEFYWEVKAVRADVEPLQVEK